MFRILPLLLLLSSPLSVFSQQSEKPLHVENRKDPAPFGPLHFRNDSITIKGFTKTTGTPPATCLR